MTAEGLFLLMSFIHVAHWVLSHQVLYLTRQWKPVKKITNSVLGRFNTRMSLMDLSKVVGSQRIEHHDLLAFEQDFVLHDQLFSEVEMLLRIWINFFSWLWPIVFILSSVVPSLQVQWKSPAELPLPLPHLAELHRDRLVTICQRYKVLFLFYRWLLNHIVEVGYHTKETSDSIRSIWCSPFHHDTNLFWVWF